MESLLDHLVENPSMDYDPEYLKFLEDKAKQYGFSFNDIQQNMEGYLAFEDEWAMTIKSPEFEFAIKNIAAEFSK